MTVSTSTPLSISIQFSDALSLWEKAFEGQGGSISFTEERNAIQIMHRMHTVRKRLRERDGATAYDLYIIVREGKKLTIKLRPQIDLGNFKAAHSPESLNSGAELLDQGLLDKGDLSLEETP